MVRKHIAGNVDGNPRFLVSRWISRLFLLSAVMSGYCRYVVGEYGGGKKNTTPIYIFGLYLTKNTLLTI